MVGTDLEEALNNSLRACVGTTTKHDDATPGGKEPGQTQVVGYKQGAIDVKAEQRVISSYPLNSNTCFLTRLHPRVCR
jgi:hypothetical protein